MTRTPELSGFDAGTGFSQRSGDAPRGGGDPRLPFDLRRRPGDTEAAVSRRASHTLVGQNNCGKSNVLRVSLDWRSTLDPIGSTPPEDTPGPQTATRTRHHSSLSVCGRLGAEQADRPLRCYRLRATVDSASRDTRVPRHEARSRCKFLHPRRRSGIRRDRDSSLTDHVSDHPDEPPGNRNAR